MTQENHEDNTKVESVGTLLEVLSTMQEELITANCDRCSSEFGYVPHHIVKKAWDAQGFTERMLTPIGCDIGAPLGYDPETRAACAVVNNLAGTILDAHFNFSIPDPMSNDEDVLDGEARQDLPQDILLDAFMVLESMMGSACRDIFLYSRYATPTVISDIANELNDLNEILKELSDYIMSQLKDKAIPAELTSVLDLVQDLKYADLLGKYHRLAISMLIAQINMKRQLERIETLKEASNG